MTIIEAMATANKCYQTEKTFVPKGIVLHSIGVAQPSAEKMAKAYNTYKPNGGSVCVHAFIEPNNVYQIMPWNRRAWHVGGYANQTHLGIEMCEPSGIKYTSGSAFTITSSTAKDYAKQTYETAVELFAQLCTEYNLDPEADGIIISHAEAYERGWGSNHADPEHLWRGLGLEYTMETFRTAVKTAMTKTEETPMAEKTMTFAEEYQKAIELGITDGSNPDNPATRKQVAVMIYRAIKIVLAKIGGVSDEL